MAVERSLGLKILLGVSLLLIGGIFFVPPIAQPASYHHFSDARAMAGVPNALNVLSNAGFLFVGIAGLWFLFRRQLFITTEERLPYIVLFCGVLLTTFGSSYYHWSPSDKTLFWDRMPMTFGFMGFFGGCVGERISPRAGRLFLSPLVVIGVASVFYWQWSGDLRPYVLVQFYPLLAIPLMMALFKPRYTRGGDILFALALYVAAKFCESYDGAIYGRLRFVSGHSIKHLLAALASFVLLRMLYLRQPSEQPARLAASGRL
ncbi:MAG: hypothetical protein ACJ71N_09245 [Terriglobales bacterium]